jgi:hypothetical protein
MPQSVALHLSRFGGYKKAGFPASLHQDLLRACRRGGRSKLAPHQGQNFTATYSMA